MAERADKREVKKVVVLLGSPRKNGNSAILAAQIAKGAKSAGGEGGDDLSSGIKHRPLQIVLRLPEKERQGLRNQR